MLAKLIMQYVETQAEGTVLSAKELLHLGSRAAVDQALSRLARAGGLLRIERGMYVAPVSSRFGNYPPKATAIAHSIAERRGREVANHGAMAANALGLTTQVPMASVFETTGPNRTFKLGRRTVEMRHVPAWHFAAKGKAGEAIRALGWLGKRNAHKAIETLRLKLNGQEQSALLHARSSLPTWMAETISALA